MNKKTEKILKWGILGGLALFLGIKLVKAYKQGMEELEDQEFQETEDLENAGVDTSKLKSEIKDDEKDFTRMLFVASRFNTELDEDLFKIQGDDGVIDNLDSKVIHVRQRFDTKIRRGEPETRRRLDFIIDIPDYTLNTYRGPKIGNFLTAFKEAAIYMSDNIVKFSNAAFRKLVCNAVISRKKGDKEIIEYREIIPEVYKVFEGDGHDGLTKFYETEIMRLDQEGPQEYTKNAPWIFTNCPDLKDDDTMLIERLVLQYIISFEIRSNRPGELYGIDTKTGVECIKYLTEKMIIGREDSRNTMTFRNLMFNAPNSEGESDLSWYYDVDSDNNVIIDNFDGFED